MSGETQADLERAREVLTEGLTKVAEEFKAIAASFQMAAEEWAAAMATLVAAYSEDEAPNPEEGSEQT